MSEKKEGLDVVRQLGLLNSFFYVLSFQDAIDARESGEAETVS